MSDLDSQVKEGLKMSTSILMACAKRIMQVVEGEETDLDVIEAAANVLEGQASCLRDWHTLAMSKRILRPVSE